MTVATKWIFERDVKTAAGLMSANRASTDALSALLRWDARMPNRSHEIVHAEDDSIHIFLRSDAADSNAASDLDMCCAQYGIQRRSLD
jgi:hypothetical protein